MALVQNRQLVFWTVIYNIRLLAPILKWFYTALFL